jgi:N-acetyl-gamma-glutamyl-phosphate reductase
MPKVKVGIVGVAGYGGGQLASLLHGHPDVELVYIASNSASGLPIGDVFPGFLGRSNLICQEFNMAKMLDTVDIVFAAQAGGWAIENASQILDAGKLLIDISADFRLRNPDSYRKWYKEEPASAELQSKAVYGMPELFREQVKDAKLIANPGCYPTSAILALAPAIKHKLVDENAIVINSMSGVSGAGRSKQTLMYHFPELNENAQAYGIAGKHRHTPEIEQALSDVAGHEIIVSFTPHLIPITRGILTTVVVPLLDDVKFESVQEVYNETYQNEPFVHMRDSKSLPTTKQTLGSNNLLISLANDERTNRLTIVSAEDNLVKGMAGQAIQNMNIMLRLDEAAGLNLPGQWP